MRFIEEDSTFDVQFGSFIQVGDGEDGATFYPSVDADGNLSWTNDKGLPNPPTVNIKGEKGEGGTVTNQGYLNFSNWTTIDFNNATYNFKLFSYNEAQNDFGADVFVRFRCKSRSGTTKDYFRYAFSVKRPFVSGDTVKSRIQFIPQRVMQEGETIGVLISAIVYEKASATNANERELWIEFKTGNGYMVDEIYSSAVNHSGKISAFEIEAKPNNKFTHTSGYDDLTITASDWSNKNAVLSLDSRATAEGATVGGTGNRVEAKNASSFGEGGNIYSTAYRSLQSGTGNKLGYNKTTDKYTGGNDGLQVGYKNHDCGARNLQGGENNDNTSTNGIQGGANTKLYAKNSTINGSSSTIEGKGYSLFQGYSGYISGEASGGIGEYIRIIHSQAFAFGRYLATGRHYQARFGVGAERDEDGNGKDKTSMIVVSNGAENGSNGVDIFAVSNAYSGDAENGYYAKASKPNDAITLGYFNSTLKQSVVDAVIDAIPRAEGVGF